MAATEGRMLPVIELSGDTRAQGLAHGRLLAPRIRNNLAVYFHRFEHEAGLRPDEVLERVGSAWPALAAQHPAYAAGVEGIAAGVGEPLARVRAALNLRYEILYHQFTAKAMVDGCTSFALLPPRTADGHLYMGQNWDWIPEVQGAVLRIAEPGLPEQLCFTEAGIFGGKIGMNAAGIGVVNGLTSTADDWTRLGAPVHVRTWQVLRSRTLEDAAAAVLAEPRSCSVHLLVAQAAGAGSRGADGDQDADGRDAGVSRSTGPGAWKRRRRPPAAWSRRRGSTATPTTSRTRRPSACVSRPRPTARARYTARRAAGRS